MEWKALLMSNFKDLTGMKFNRFTVVGKCEERNKQGAILWLCVCDCGNERKVISASLKNGNSKSCGCLQREKVVEMNKEKKVDMSGMKIGRLTVINSVGVNKHGNHVWLCKCDCGNEKTIPQGRLVSEKDREMSCGCAVKDIVSETGRKYGGRNFEDISGGEFGRLTVIERDWSIKKNPVYFCKCSCGGLIVAKGKLLKNGHVSSCGCLKSKAEEEVEKLLLGLNVFYKKQYRFDDCRNINPLPFDFCVLNEEGRIICLIELDGSQHFIQYKNRSELEYVKNNDRIKNKYCKNKNLKLLRIPYTEFNIKENIIMSYLVELGIIEQPKCRELRWLGSSLSL